VRLALHSSSAALQQQLHWQQQTTQPVYLCFSCHHRSVLKCLEFYTVLLQKRDDFFLRQTHPEIFGWDVCKEMQQQQQQP